MSFWKQFLTLKKRRKAARNCLTNHWINLQLPRHILEEIVAEEREYFGDNVYIVLWAWFNDPINTVNMAAELETLIHWRRSRIIIALAGGLASKQLLLRQRHKKETIVIIEQGVFLTLWLKFKAWWANNVRKAANNKV